MSSLREAAQLALEALEYGQHSLKQISEYQWESRGQLAMDALKAALEQPEPAQEPFSSLRDLLTQAAAMAVASERAGKYEGASWVADAVLAQEQPEPAQEPSESSCDECGKSKADGWALYCVECLEQFFHPTEPAQERDDDRRREYGYSQQVVDALTNEREELRAQRDALLRALNMAVQWVEEYASQMRAYTTSEQANADLSVIYAAIKAVEGEKE